MPCAIIQQQCEKCGLVRIAPLRRRHAKFAWAVFRAGDATAPLIRSSNAANRHCAGNQTKLYDLENRRERVDFNGGWHYSTKFDRQMAWEEDIVQWNAASFEPPRSDRMALGRRAGRLCYP